MGKTCSHRQQVMSTCQLTAHNVTSLLRTNAAIKIAPCYDASRSPGGPAGHSVRVISHIKASTDHNSCRRNEHARSKIAVPMSPVARDIDHFHAVAYIRGLVHSSPSMYTLREGYVVLTLCESHPSTSRCGFYRPTLYPFVLLHPGQGRRVTDVWDVRRCSNRDG